MLASGSRSALSRACLVGAGNRLPAIASGAAVATPVPSGPGASVRESVRPSVPVHKAATPTRCDTAPGAFGHFTFVQYLGVGANGVVYEVTNRLDLQQYAIKCIPFSWSSESARVLREVQTMARVPPHENLVRYFSCWVEKLTLALFEFMSSARGRLDGGLSVSSSLSRGLAAASHVLFIQMECCQETLRTWMTSRGSFINPAQALDIFRQMVRGVQHLHTNGVVHNDVKPDNAFIDTSGVVKIGDFGDCGASSSHVLGTASYSPPENNASMQGDVFSLGLCLMELFSSFSTGMERALAFNDVRSGALSMPWTSEFPDVATMVRAMTAAKPESRPSLSDLLEWPLVRVVSPIIGRLQEALNAKDEMIQRLQLKLASVS